ncbi:MAG: diaminopimelate epimerase [Myxococcales bacterium]|nr:diaminopimelate epimerase [Myxococcales bacterium]
MSKIPFVKAHGLGNDFILIDWRDADRPFPLDRVVPLCDRRFGIGADGILLVLPGETEAFRMRIYNSDGSLAEMCGNGIRCFALYLNRYLGVTSENVTIETDAGPLSCHFDDPESPEQFTINMGRAYLARADIPMAGTGDPFEQTVEAGGRELVGHGVGMGNPHFILFGDWSRSDVDRLGPELMQHALFPRRTNVEFAQMQSAEEIDLTVYERGCGVTMACGTGASATAVAAVRTGLSAPNTDIAVNLPGGTLTIRVEEDYSSVWMTGPAVVVYEGAVEL